MQKKLIALAVAGLVSAPAFAQSNVTVYGLVDVGVSHRSDNADRTIGSRSAVDSGQQSGNRIGFRGTEDLGNGLKASFVLETGLNVDTGGLSANGSSNDRGFGRQSFIALSGNFGTVALGRMYTPQFNLVSKVDPFGTGTVGQVNNLYDLNVRLDNVAAYVSPSFSGFNVVVAYTRSGLRDEAVDNRLDRTVFAISPSYSNGPLFVGLNYHRIGGDGNGADTETKVWDLGATYDFGVAKIAALYGKRVTERNVADNRYWMIGGTIPVTEAGSVLVSYTRWKDKEINDKARQWAVGYTHALSKRTNLYAAYADIGNRTGGITRSVGDSSNAGNGYQQGFNLGVRHTF